MGRSRPPERSGGRIYIASPGDRRTDGDAVATPVRDLSVMLEIALLLLASAVFAALTFVAVTAALRAARVEDVIGEVFSPWLQDPFGSPETGEPASRNDDGPPPQHPRSAEATAEERRAIAARA